MPTERIAEQETGFRTVVSRQVRGSTRHNTIARRRLRSTYALDCFSVFAKTRPLSAFAVMVWHIFDADIPYSAIEALYDDLRERKFQDPRNYDPSTDLVVNPPILVENDPRLVPGVRARRRVRTRPMGAYSQGGIHVSAELVQMARAEPRCGFMLQIVLLEEFGHHLDSLLRNRYSTVGGDARFDEGAIFALHMHPVRDGDLERFPFAYDDDGFAFELITADAESVDEVLSPERIRADETGSTHEGESVEYFDAHASPVLSRSHRSGRASEVRGHREIDYQLMCQSIHSEWRRRFLWVYFGNWLRDISQISLIFLAPGIWVDEARGRYRGYLNCVSQALQSDGGTPTSHVDALVQCRAARPVPAGGTAPSAVAALEEVYLQFVNGYAEWDLIRLANEMRESSRPWPLFATNAADAAYRLGGYEACEHLDNPGGVRAVNVARDSDRYLQPTHIDESVSYVHRQLELALAVNRPLVENGSSRRIDADKIRWMYFGNVLHAIEDYFAHSNFVELCLAGYLESGGPTHEVDTKVPYVEPGGTAPGALTWDRPSTRSPDRPLMTGRFGGFDTAVSFLAMAAEALGEWQQGEENSPNSSKHRLLLIVLRRVSPELAIFFDRHYLQNEDLRSLVGVIQMILRFRGLMPDDEASSAFEGLPNWGGFSFLSGLREPYDELAGSVSEKIQELAVWAYKELAWSLTQFVGGAIIKELAGERTPPGLARLSDNQRDGALALLEARDVSGLIDLLGAAFGLPRAAISAAHVVCVAGEVEMSYEIRSAAARSTAILGATVPGPQLAGLDGLVESIGLRTWRRHVAQSIPPAHAFHALELLVGLYQEIASEGSFDPTHTQLSKDHGTHPLHSLAAELALWADQKMMLAMDPAWRALDQRDSDRIGRALRELQETASKILRHPVQYHRDAGRQGPVGSWRNELLIIINDWKGTHPAETAIIGASAPTANTGTSTAVSPGTLPNRQGGHSSPSDTSASLRSPRGAQLLLFGAALNSLSFVFGHARHGPSNASASSHAESAR